MQILKMLQNRAILTHMIIKEEGRLMFFRSPIVRFFNRILNRVTITVVLVALQLLWLCWVF